MEPLFSSDRLDYTMLIEMFGGGGYDLCHSPPACTGTKRQIITGDPDFEGVSTSDLEHNKLTTRIGMRASRRLTDAFRKKVENHAAAISLHFMFYNFARPHATLSEASGTRKRITPAMAAGVANHVWSAKEVAALLD